MDDKYRRAFTATILTYISTAKDVGQDPLGLAKLPLAASIVTGRELSLRLGRTIHKKNEKDSLWWVRVDPASGKMLGYEKIATDLSKFRAKLNKQLKAWGKKSDIKKLMTKRAVNIAIVAGVTTAVIVATVVLVTVPGAAAAAGTFLTTTGGKLVSGAKTAGKTIADVSSKVSKVAGPTKQAMSAINAVQDDGGNIDDMAKAAKSSVPPEQEKALVQEAQQTAVQTEEAAEIGLSTGTIALGLGVGAAGLAAVGTAVYLATRK